jgi:hypothetical protein
MEECRCSGEDQEAEEHEKYLETTKCTISGVSQTLVMSLHDVFVCISLWLVQLFRCSLILLDRFLNPGSMFQTCLYQ